MTEEPFTDSDQKRHQHLYDRAMAGSGVASGTLEGPEYAIFRSTLARLLGECEQHDVEIGLGADKPSLVICPHSVLYDDEKVRDRPYWMRWRLIMARITRDAAVSAQKEAPEGQEGHLLGRIVGMQEATIRGLKQKLRRLE